MRFKKYYPAKSPKEELKIVRKNANLILFAMIIVMLLLLWMIWEQNQLISKATDIIDKQNYRLDNEGPRTYDNYSIEFLDLNVTQKDIILDLFEQVNPMYLKHLKEIIFTNNQEIVSGACGGDNCLGVNAVGQGIIHILYVDDIKWMKQAICHELLHNYIYLTSHEIVYDLGKKQACMNGYQLEILTDEGVIIWG